MSALISKGQQNKRGLDVPLLLGVELKDAQEELFVILVCDGLPMGLAFKRAGFTSKHSNAPSNLFNLPRVQERAKAILAARRETGAVSLPQVTDMLQRVFAGAHSEGEYSAAHNAAFSLARLYGHVTDKATLEVIRRPSRDPDAPSETALEDWAASLPVVEDLSKAAFQGPSADPLGLECITPTTQPHVVCDNNGATQGPGRDGGAQTGNGAPVGPVTGTPAAGGGSDLLGPLSTKKGTGTPTGVADQSREVPGYGEGVDWPKAEDLF